VFAGALRWWIADQKPNPSQGVADLKRLFELQINGLRRHVSKLNRRPLEKQYGRSHN
jgi:hypothetical protein